MNSTSGRPPRRAPFLGAFRLGLGVAVTPDGRQIVSGGDDGSVRVWDRDTGAEQAALTGHTGPVRAVAVAVAPDGRQIVVLASTARRRARPRGPRSRVSGSGRPRVPGHTP
jgi:WD40 repeat protein